MSTQPTTPPRRKPYEIRYATEYYPNALWSVHFDYEAARAELARVQILVANSPHSEARRSVRNLEIV